MTTNTLQSIPLSLISAREGFNPRKSYRQQPMLFLGNIHPQLQLNVLRQMSNEGNGGQHPLRALDTMNL